MQTQQYIRSTVSFPLDLHKKLRMEAISKKMTFSEVVLSKMMGSDGRVNMEEALAFFKKIRQSGPAFDGVETIRKNRDEGTI